MNKPVYKTLIPNSVSFNTNLKPMAKILYGEIRRRPRETNWYFAELYGLDERSVKRLFKCLVKEGCISVAISGPKRTITPLVAPGRHYITLPSHVRYDPDLPANGKLIYAEIVALCRWKGYCSAGNDHFARLFRLDVHRVKRLLSILRKKRYIQWELRRDEYGYGRKISIADTMWCKNVTDRVIKLHPIVSAGV